MGVRTGTKEKAGKKSAPKNKTPNRRSDGPPPQKELEPITKRCPIIGITGPAGCGKGTAADYLSAYYGFRGTSFATPLKKAAAIVFNMPEQDMFTEVREKKEAPIEIWGGLSIRRMLQLLGTEVARAIYVKVWINNMHLRTQEYRDLNMGIVIDDVRFDNEAEWIRENGGKVFHLSRPSDENGTKHTNHASEAGVEKKGEDIALVNNGTIGGLHFTLDRIMEDQRLGLKLKFKYKEPTPNTEKQDQKPPDDYPKHVQPPVYKVTSHEKSSS